MSRSRWKYPKKESSDIKLATMLYSDFVSMCRLSCCRQVVLDFDGDSVGKRFTALETIFDPLEVKVLRRYFSCNKPRITKVEAARMLSMTTYRFTKLTQRFNTLLEQVVMAL